MWLYSPLPLGASVIQSAALGGSAITPQQGTAKADRSVPLTTSAITSGLGTPGALDHGTTVAISTTNSEGFQTVITSARGNVGATQTIDTVAIFGEESTSGIGSVAPDYSRALTTSASTCFAGNLGVENKPTQIVLGPITASTGDVTPSGFSVTVNLNAGEIEMLAFVGSVQPAAVLSGSGITSALQSFATVENTPTDTLLGIQFTASTGTMAANQDVEDTYISSNSGAIVSDHQMALTGQEILGLQDSVSPTEDTTLDLVGEPATASAGDVGFSNEIPLTGEQFLGEQYYVGAPGYAELNGEESIASAGEVRDFTGEDRDFPLVGQEIVATSDAALPYTTIIPLFNDGLQITSEQFLFAKEAELVGEQATVYQGRVAIEGGDKGAGNPGKGKGKGRKTVIVDGQTFEVNEDELKDLIQVVEEVATAKAKEEADAAVAALVAAKSTEKVRLKTPKVTGSEELKDKLADIYAQAAIDAQVALEVSRNRQLDEEEAIVLLLVN